MDSQNYMSKIKQGIYDKAHRRELMDEFEKVENKYAFVKQHPAIFSTASRSLTQYPTIKFPNGTYTQTGPYSVTEGEAVYILGTTTFTKPYKLSFTVPVLTTTRNPPLTMFAGVGVRNVNTPSGTINNVVSSVYSGIVNSFSLSAVLVGSTNTYGAESITHNTFNATTSFFPFPINTTTIFTIAEDDNGNISYNLTNPGSPTNTYTATGLTLSGEVRNAFIVFRSASPINLGNAPAIGNATINIVNSIN